MKPRWIDTHCHLDDARLDADRDAVVARAQAAGVVMQVLPGVVPANFDTVRGLAARHGLAYALGSHPMYLAQAGAGPLAALRLALDNHRDDPRLVAVGEIGIDHFMPGLDRTQQFEIYLGQLRLARAAGLPVLLHGRKAWDQVLAGLNRIEVPGGIAHAFNGSAAQARRLLEAGIKLGFGGAFTFERALHLRELARSLPDEAFVMETDAPDIPPQWAYRTAAERAAGAAMRNEPAEVVAIGAALAQLRGVSAEAWAERCRANTLAVLPRLAPLLEATAPAPG